MDGIDHEWLEREIGSVRSELVRMFPATSPAQVSAAVDAAVAELVPPARVATYLPILIRRRAQHQLSETPPAGGTGPRRTAR